jgi:hypothetical protein
MTAGRYRIRRKPDLAPDVHPDGSPAVPYGLWDTLERRWVDKYGRPDTSYYACCADVARMRWRDLNDPDIY